MVLGLLAGFSTLGASQAVACGSGGHAYGIMTTPTASNPTGTFVLGSKAYSKMNSASIDPACPVDFADQEHWLVTKQHSPTVTYSAEWLEAGLIVGRQVCAPGYSCTPAYRWFWAENYSGFSPSFQYHEGGLPAPPAAGVAQPTTLASIGGTGWNVYINENLIATTTNVAPNTDQTLQAGQENTWLGPNGYDGHHVNGDTTNTMYKGGNGVWYTGWGGGLYQNFPGLGVAWVTTGVSEHDES